MTGILAPVCAHMSSCLQPTQPAQVLRPDGLGDRSPRDTDGQLDRPGRTQVELVSTLGEFREDQRVNQSRPGRPGHDGDMRPVMIMVVIMPMMIVIMPMMVVIMTTDPVDLHLGAGERGRHGHHQSADVTADVEEHGALAGVRILG